MSQRRATPEEMAEKARRDAIRDRLDPNRQQRESYQSLPDTMSEEAKRAITFQRFYPDKARQGLDYFGNPIDSNQTNPNYYGDELPDFLTSSPTMPFDMPTQGITTDTIPQGPIAPPGGFLPGNPVPLDYDRPPQIYRPPADDPRDPRTKGMYPTGGFDYPPIAPTPTGPMVPPLGEVSPLDLGPSLQPSAPLTESEMLQREAFGKYMAEQAALGGDPNSPRTDDNPGGYLGMQRATPQFQEQTASDTRDPRSLWYGDDPGSEMRNINSFYGGHNRPLSPTSQPQEQTGISPDPFMMGGIMSQAPSSMTDPFSMDMMASPMNFGQASESQAGPSAGSYMAPSPVPTLSASTNNFSNYLTGGMGTGMSAGGGIMSMANPMQSQMAMMPQQMMQQGGYAPRPQTMQQPVAQSLSYGQTPANSQSLYGTQTGSQNNQQSLYGSQHNSPFAGASRGYYA